MSSLKNFEGHHPSKFGDLVSESFQAVRLGTGCPWGTNNWPPVTKNIEYFVAKHKIIKCKLYRIDSADSVAHSAF